MKVSVVIPFYNSENTILNCLDSVKNQKFDYSIEIIAVNDGSFDNSEKLVRDYITQNPLLNIKLFNQQNGGVSKARNTGIKNSNGDYIAFLDADDIWLENKLDIQFRILENKKNNIHFIACGFEDLYFREKDDGSLIKIEIKNLIFKNYFQPSTVMMKKEIIGKIGFFDENQYYAEEGNYFIRIAKYYNCFFLNSKLINYGSGKSGFGESGLSSNIKEMEKGFQMNLRYAYQNNYISYSLFLIARVYSKLKYFRRILIIIFRK